MSNHFASLHDLVRHVRLCLAAFAPTQAAQHVDAMFKPWGCLAVMIKSVILAPVDYEPTKQFK